MPYYDTIDEDLARAKAILKEGKPEEASLARTIYGKDTFAAYKLLESFVEEIERLHDKLNACENNLAEALKGTDGR